MKKTLTMTAGAIALLVAVSCKKGGDLKAAGQEYLANIESINSSLEKATTGKEAAAVLMKAQESSDALEKKFPQLKNIEKDPAFAGIQTKLTELQMKFMETLGKADDKFKDDPDFAAAMKKIIKTGDAAK